MILLSARKRGKRSLSVPVTKIMLLHSLYFTLITAGWLKPMFRNSVKVGKVKLPQWKHWHQPRQSVEERLGLNLEIIWKIDQVTFLFTVRSYIFPGLKGYECDRETTSASAVSPQLSSFFSLLFTQWLRRQAMNELSRFNSSSARTPLFLWFIPNTYFGARQQTGPSFQHLDLL